MKIFQSFLSVSGSAILAAGLLMLPGSAHATAKGGAVRQLALSRSLAAPSSEIATSTSATAMSCAQCQDTQSVVTQATFKAAQPVVKRVVSTHECPGCTMQVSMKGHGKMTSSMMTHQCQTDPNGCGAMQ